MPPRDLGLKARARLGTTLRGKYLLESVLGTGGMAVVYRARHRNRAEFAVKMLLPEYSDDEQVRSRFLREGYAANSVKHPGAVAIVDDDVAEDGSAFLVMELLDGMSVEELAGKHGRLDPRVATALACEALEVLAAAHAAGIVHRDIKPANLFVTRQGVVKVLDFGIARVRDLAGKGAQATQSGFGFGTPAFMSPEQALARSSDIDGRSDVFSMGATLFNLLTGDLVHVGVSAQELLVKVATTPARPIRSVMPELPEPLAGVVDRLLAFQREARWSAAAEMRDALLAALQRSYGPVPPARDVLAGLLAGLPPKLDHAPDASSASATVDTAVKTVTHDRDGLAGRRARAALIGVGAAALVGALTFVTARVIGSHSTSTAPAMQPASAQGPILSAPPTPASPPPSTASATPVIAVTSLPATSPPPIGHATAAAATKALVKPRPDCTPAYVVDEDGNKHFKPECYPK